MNKESFSDIDLNALGEQLTTKPAVTYNRLETAVPIEEPTGNVFAATFFRDTSIGSFLTRPEATAFDPEKNNNLDFIKFVPDRHKAYLDAYALVTNAEEAQSVMRSIDEENERTALVAANPWKSFFYNFGLQPIDPANWLPGGVIFKNVKRMSRAAKGAIQAGASGLVSTAAQEVLLQGTQLTREVEESIMNTVVGGFFSAAIGGVAPVFGPKLKRFGNRAKENAKSELMNVFTDKDTPLSPYKDGGSAAHITNNQLAKMPKTVQKLIRINTMNEMLTSEFQAPKDVAANAFENNYTLIKNEKGVATLNAETTIKRNLHELTNTFIEVDNLFFEQAGIQSGIAKEFRANRAAKLDTTGGILNYNKFQSAIAYTIFTGTVHANDAVNKAAKILVERIFEPYRKALVDVGLLSKDATVQNAIEYFPISWNQQKLKEDKAGFIKMTTDWIKRIDGVVNQIHQHPEYKAAQQEIKSAKVLKDQVTRVKRGQTPPEVKKLEQQARKDERALRRTVKNVAKSPEYRATEKEIRTLEHNVRVMTRDTRKANVKAIKSNLGELKKKLNQVKKSVKGFAGDTNYLSLDLDLKLTESLRKESQAEVSVLLRDLSQTKAKAKEARAKLAELKKKAAPSPEVERLLDMEIDLHENRLDTLNVELKKQREKVNQHQAEVEKIKERKAAIEKQRNQKANTITKKTLRELKKYPELEGMVKEIKNNEKLIEKSAADTPEIKELRKKIAEKEGKLKELVRKVDKSPEYQSLLTQIKETKEKIKEAKKTYSVERLDNLKEKVLVLEAEANKVAENIAARFLDKDEIAAIFHQSEGKRGRLRSPIKDPDFITADANKTYDRIIGNDIGGANRAVISKLNARPSSAKNRTFMIPQRLAFEWQNQNASEVAEKHARAVLPTVRMTETAMRLGYKSIEDWHNNAISDMNLELTQRLTGLNAKDQKKVDRAFEKYGKENYSKAYKIKEQLLKKSKGVKGEEAAKLDKEFKRQKQNITNTFEILLGIYGNGPNVHDSSAAKYYKAFLNWNYIRLLGFMTLSAIPDLGMHVLTHGPFATMYHGLRPVLGEMFGIMKNMSKDDINAIGYGLNTVKGTRLKSMAGHEGLSTQPSFFGRTFDKMVDTFGNLVFMNQWNDSMQVIAGTMSINRSLKAIEAWHNGKISDDEITRLARLGISVSDYQIIYDKWKKHGGSEDGTHFANWVDWEIKNKADRRALERFKDSVAKEIDSVVITPGLGDKPLMAQTDLGRLMLQFKSFAFAATNKILFAGIQRRHDMNTYWGMSAMLGLGAFSYVATQVVRGNDDIDLSFSKLSREAIDRSGLIGIIGEVYNMAEKAGLGFGDPPSRYQSRSLWGAMLGPSTGAFDELFNLVNRMRKADGENPLTVKDFQTIMRLAPYQNVFYIYYLSRKVSGPVAKSLGFEEEQDAALKRMFK